MTPSTTSRNDLPLLLLHGFTGSGAAWGPVLDHVRQRQPDVVARTPELLGHGETPIVDPDSFRAEVRRIAEHVRQLAADTGHPVQLVGYSLGARVALGVLVDHRLTPRTTGPGATDSTGTEAPLTADELARVTLIGVHPGLPEEQLRTERRDADRQWIDLLREEGLEAFVQAWEALPLFASQEQLAPAVQQAQRAWRRGHSAEALARSLEILGLAEMPAYGELLMERWQAATAADRSLPTLSLVTGADDAKFTTLATTLAERLRAACPDTSVSVRALPGVGHNPLLENPAVLADSLTTPAKEQQP